MSKNYWNSCPQKNSAFPEKPCPLGKSSTQSKDAHISCEWAINSSKDNYCFWKWVRSRSDIEGGMKPLATREMTKLLKLSYADIEETFAAGVKALKNNKEFQDLKAILVDSCACWGVTIPIVTALIL